MSKFHMDLSKFRKVSSDEKSTTLRHEDGHTIQIAHTPLSPKLRGQLAALPGEDVAMAEGGAVDKPWTQKEKEDFSAGASGHKPSPKPSTTSGERYGSPIESAEDAAEYGEQQSAKQYGPAYADGGPVDKPWTQQDKKDFDKGASSGDVSVGQAIDNAKKALGFADGGGVDLEGLAAKLAPMVAMAMAKGGPVPKSPMHMAKMPVPNYSKNIPHFADGGEANSDSVKDSPEQIAADAAASAPTQVQGPAPVSDPQLEAKRAAYNQLVQANMYGKTGLTQGNESDAANAQFGANGQPPANFNPDLWNQASQGYDQSQKAELAQKQQATAKMAQDNQARVAAGLSPIPITSDEAASVVPPGGQNTASVPATPQTPPDSAIPGDKEMSQLQNGRQAVSSAIPRSPAAAPGASPTDTAQKLVAAKQLTFDALMHERQQILEQMKTAEPETLGKIFDDKSWHGKIGMLAGLMLGGAASAQLGQENNVVKMYQGMIDNNLKAQQLNMAQKQNLLSNNMAMTGNVKDAIALSKVQMNDLMMHKLVQLAAKYPNNPQIQQNLQAMGMMGMQSSSNIMDSLAANQAWRHAASQIQDPLQKIQFNPLLTPEQKNAAIKEYGEYQNMDSLRNDTLSAFDKVAKLNTFGNRISSPIQTPRQIEELRNITLDKLTKDTSGRVTPETTQLVGSVFSKMADSKVTVAQGREELAKILSQNMHFPHLQLAGVNLSAPTPGGITTAPPKLGK